jgi:hypothetical protein
VVIAENAVLRDDDPRIGGLPIQGWRIVARSWAARLNAVDVNAERLTALVEAMPNDCVGRELEISDKAAILALDAATVRDSFPVGLQPFAMR